MSYRPETNPSPASQRMVEAARYALLRRLAFAMRHNMVVHLQPIRMVTEVMERRLKAPAPDLAQVHDAIQKIDSYSRAAVASSLDVITWLAPEAGIEVALDEGVRECVELLHGSFSFRGFILRSQVEHAPLRVPQAGLRHLLPACLFALTDQAGSPAEVVISAELADPASLTVTVQPSDGTAGFAEDPPYRALQWPEVQAMASADGIELIREGDTIRLLLARAQTRPAPDRAQPVAT